jgi:uncharacterized repeat protein (TIGR01451 family)
MAYPQVLLLLPLFVLLFGKSHADVSASVKTMSSWGSGGQFQVVINNNGPNPLCGVVFQLTMPNGVCTLSRKMKYFKAILGDHFKQLEYERGWISRPIFNAFMGEYSCWRFFIRSWICYEWKWNAKC